MSLRIILPRVLRRALVASAGRPFIASVPSPPRILAPLPRWNSTLTNTPATPALTSASREPAPSYQLTFTCRPCRTRSTHTISKQAYHKGTVLIQCPGCNNRHLITDHLKIFGEQQRSLEDILQEDGNGEVLKKARMLENGDIEMLSPEEAAAEGGEQGETKTIA